MIIKKINRNFTGWFKKNKSKELYSEILDEYFTNNIKCKDCGDVVYYYDSEIKTNRNNEFILFGKTYLSEKTIFDKKYNLQICEDCLSIKFPEYQKMNKSRVFNRICDITCYAFNIPDIIKEKWVSENYSITEENLIIKYGDSDGRERWKKYCEKQALTNSFEYKKDKYGWDENDFNKYNKSRAVTIDNLTLKHGKEKGLSVWNNYIEQQRYTCSRQYFIEEYGEEKGEEKFKNFCEKRQFPNGYSPISQELFTYLDRFLSNYQTFFAEKNKEYAFYDSYSGKNYFVDFYIKELNLIIEFNGDIYHANPEKYNHDDTPHPFLRNKKSIDIWESDEKKIDFLKTKVRDVIIIWEKDFNRLGLDSSVNYLLKEIKKYE